MKKQLRPWIDLILLTFGLSSLVLLFFKLLHQLGYAFVRYLVIFEFAFISLVLPICFVHIHLFIKAKYKLQDHILIHTLLIFACIAFSSLLDWHTW